MGRLMGNDVFEGKEPPILVVYAMVILAVERAMAEVVDVVLELVLARKSMFMAAATQVWAFERQFGIMYRKDVTIQVPLF
jgi:hypothetical protein